MQTVSLLALAVALPFSLLATGVSVVTWWISRGRRVEELATSMHRGVQSFRKELSELGSSLDASAVAAESKVRVLVEEAAESFDRAETARRRAASTLSQIERHKQQPEANGAAEGESVPLGSLPRGEQIRMLRERFSG
ncbi:MAG: hypothetical protein ABGY41_18075 [Candidatus Poribacteria bacterium]